jgi:hypothetical protein
MSKMLNEVVRRLLEPSEEISAGRLVIRAGVEGATDLPGMFSLDIMVSRGGGGTKMLVERLTVPAPPFSVAH